MYTFLFPGFDGQPSLLYRLYKGFQEQLAMPYAPQEVGCVLIISVAFAANIGHLPGSAALAKA